MKKIIAFGLMLMLLPLVSSKELGEKCMETLTELSPAIPNVIFACLESCEVNLIRCIPIWIKELTAIIALNPIAFLLGWCGCLSSCPCCRCIGCSFCYLCGLTFTTPQQSNNAPQFVVVKRGCSIPLLAFIGAGYYAYTNLNKGIEDQEINTAITDIKNKRILPYE